MKRHASPIRYMTFDEAERAGLDGTGRDGDLRFPYHAEPRWRYLVRTYGLDAVMFAGIVVFVIFCGTIWA